MNTLFLAENSEFICNVGPIDVNTPSNNFATGSAGGINGNNDIGGSPDIKPDTVPPAGKNNAVPDGVVLPRPGRSAAGVDALMADIAVAIAKLQTEMRKQNREQTMVETEAVVKEMNTQADEIKSKAVKQFVGGLVSGILTTAAGVVTLGGSVSALNGLTKNLAAGNMTVQEALARMENTSTFWSSIAKIGEGVGNIWNTGWNYGAGLNEADIKRSEARQQWHQSAIDNLKSYSDSCKEVADRALNTAETILQSSNQLRQRVLG